MRSLINPWYFIWYVTLSFLTGWCNIYYLQNKKWVMAAVFTIFLTFYIYNAVFRAGGIIIMDEKGVEKRVLGIKCSRFSWEELGEVGVAGLDLFWNRKRKGKRYLYFSRDVMTEEERFNMCLNWLPKDKIAVKYDPEWLEYAIQEWKREPIFYNTDRISVETEP